MKKCLFLIFLFYYMSVHAASGPAGGVFQEDQSFFSHTCEDILFATKEDASALKVCLPEPISCANIIRIDQTASKDIELIVTPAPSCEQKNSKQEPVLLCVSSEKAGYRDLVDSELADLNKQIEKGEPLHFELLYNICEQWRESVSIAVENTWISFSKKYGNGNGWKPKVFNWKKIAENPTIDGLMQARLFAQDHDFETMLRDYKEGGRPLAHTLVYKGDTTCLQFILSTGLVRIAATEGTNGPTAPACVGFHDLPKALLIMHLLHKAGFYFDPRRNNHSGAILYFKAHQNEKNIPDTVIAYVQWVADTQNQALAERMKTKLQQLKLKSSYVKIIKNNDIHDNTVIAWRPKSQK